MTDYEKQLYHFRLRLQQIILDFDIMIAVEKSVRFNGSPNTHNVNVDIINFQRDFEIFSDNPDIIIK